MTPGSGGLTTTLPAPIQGYVDDVSLSADTEADLQTMARKTESFVTSAQMTIKHRKCAILQGQRSGNNWSKNSKTNEIQINIQNANLPIYEREKTYPYLGHEIRIDNKNENSVLLIETFIDTLKKIDRSLLPSSAKLQAINIMCISKLNFYFANSVFSESELKTLEDEIVSYARHWLKLNNSSARAFFFVPRSKGGLGLISPKIAYYAKHLQFTLSVLNSDDTAVQTAARASLTLHMTKRKVTPDNGENSFAGYKVLDNKLDKGSKVNWPKSNWNHVFEMCNRENIKLQKTADGNFKYIYETEIEGTITPVHCEHPKAFYFAYKEHKLKQKEDDFKSLLSQGRVCREAASDADMCLSSSYLRNHKISDDIKSFVVRARLQILQCNSLLHTYYNIGKDCGQCNFYSETVSHILNGCRAMQALYQKRHNRIIDMLHKKITTMTIHKESRIIKDSIITPQLFDANSEILNFDAHATRPDIVIINDSEKTAFIIEFSAPFDAFIGKCYSEKFSKYFPLSLEINSLGYHTKIVVLIIGSLGHVHKRFVNGLKMIGLTNTDSKFTAKFYSTSIIIGSFKIWKQRCRKTDYVIEA